MSLCRHLFHFHGSLVVKVKQLFVKESHVFCSLALFKLESLSGVLRPNTYWGCLVLWTGRQRVPHSLHVVTVRVVNKDLWASLIWSSDRCSATTPLPEDSLDGIKHTKVTRHAAYERTLQHRLLERSRWMGKEWVCWCASGRLLLKHMAWKSSSSSLVPDVKQLLSHFERFGHCLRH